MGGHLFGHIARLDGQFKGGRQANDVRVVFVRLDTAQHGQHKGSRLTRSRLRLSDHVLGPVI